ncbi:integrase [Spartobacteria bacterium LR76]|nr:integrase [Spartobacteria bacterium LR76]
MGTSAESAGRRYWLIKRVIKDGEQVSRVARELGFSRKTAHKWLRRYREASQREHGVEAGLGERVRGRPIKISAKMLDAVVQARRAHPTWGARKLYQILPEPRPALRSLERCLARLGLTRWRKCRALRGPSLPRRPMSEACAPNDVWTMDFKGWFRTGDAQRCDLLTVRDLFSRYGLAIEAVHGLSEQQVRACCQRLFARYGLPWAIRVDHGSPFCSTGPYELSRLSLWWRRLGIRVEPTRRGCPQDNGSHEQFHRVYRHEAANPPAPTLAAQIERSITWLEHYNTLRPHDALGLKTPSHFYRKSRRRYRPLPDQPSYPSHWKVLRVNPKGYIRWKGRLRLITQIASGLLIGLAPLSDHCRVYIDRILLGTLYPNDPGGMRQASFASSPPPSPLSPISGGNV